MASEYLNSTRNQTTPSFIAPEIKGEWIGPGGPPKGPDIEIKLPQMSTAGDHAFQLGTALIEHAMGALPKDSGMPPLPAYFQDKKFNEWLKSSSISDMDTGQQPIHGQGFYRKQE